MYYGKIMYCDTANGTGCRTVLFVSGCHHHCKGCFNEIAWKFDYGKEYTPETEDKIVESLKPDYVEGLSILGGEPLEPENQEEVWNQERNASKKHLGIFRFYVGRTDRERKSEMQTGNG